MFDRWIEGGLLNVLRQEGIGCIVFSPLAQGLLTDKYLNGASRCEQIDDAVGALKNLTFASEELQSIENILAC